jgi:hypothetical protein
MVAHAVVAVCLMKAESRLGESDGFDSRWAGVDEQGKWLGWRVEDGSLDQGWKRASRLRGNDTLDRAVVVE